MFTSAEEDKNNSNISHRTQIWSDNSIQGQNVISLKVCINVVSGTCVSGDRNTQEFISMNSICASLWMHFLCWDITPASKTISYWSILSLRHIWLEIIERLGEIISNLILIAWWWVMSWVGDGSELHSIEKLKRNQDKIQLDFCTFVRNRILTLSHGLMAK